MASISTYPISPRYDEHFTLSYSYPANALSGGTYQLQSNTAPASSLTTITGEYATKTSTSSSHITSSLSSNPNPIQSMAINPLNQNQLYISLRGYGLLRYDASAQTYTVLLTSAQMLNIDNCAVAADASYVYLGHYSGQIGANSSNGCVYRYRLSDSSFITTPFVDLGVATGVIDNNRVVINLFVSGSTLYIGGLNSLIYTADLTNSDPTTNTFQFYQGNVSTNTEFAIDSTYLYYATSETNVVYRVPLANPTISNATTLATLATNPLGLCVSGSHLFVADGSKIVKISIIDGSYSTVDTLSYAKNAVMSSTGKLYVITANLTPLANSVYTYIMNTSIQFSDVYYPYYSTAFVFNLYNTTKNTVSDIFTVNVTCFLEGTKILCLSTADNKEQYVSIEHLKKGDLIKTASNGYLPLESMGRSRVYHNPPLNQSESTLTKKDALYIYRREDVPELMDDLCVTGMHSALVEEISENEKDAILNTLEDVYLTENLYRLPACVDKRARIYDQEGYFNVYHIALSNTDYYGNYGVYANGMLMETTSLRYLKELAQMELLF